MIARRMLSSFIRNRNRNVVPLLSDQHHPSASFRTASRASLSALKSEKLSEEVLIQLASAKNPDKFGSLGKSRRAKNPPKISKSTVHNRSDHEHFSSSVMGNQRRSTSSVQQSESVRPTKPQRSQWKDLKNPKSSSTESAANPNENVSEHTYEAEDLEHDVFGTISSPDWKKVQLMENLDEDADAVQEMPWRQRPWYYLVKVRKFIKKDHLPAALEYFEMKMKKEDQVRPLRSVYDMLIAACGRAGYTPKAFSLFNEMKMRRFLPVDATYVGLFNACAENPDKDDGLRRAQKLRDELQRKNHTPNQIVYHSMIKAFGRCGDLLTAFQLADEMKTNQVLLDDQTFCFLLMAAITDKSSGFKHAVEIWRLMVKSGVRPNLYHYNLLLKAIRDCGVGSEGFLSELLPPSHDQVAIKGSVLEMTLRDQMDQQREKNAADLRRKLALDQFLSTPPDENLQDALARKVSDMLLQRADQLGPLSVTASLAAEEKFMRVSTQREQWWRKEAWSDSLWSNVDQPTKVDLLLPLEAQSRSSVIAFNQVQTPQQRMELLGGYPEFMRRMARDQVSPDKKCLTQLVETLPPSIQADLDLIDIARKAKVKLDIDFYNTLIKRRCFLHDYVGAQEILRMAQKVGLLANEMTFGCLAIGCRNWSSAEQLFKDMECANVTPNIRIFGAFVKQACYHLDPWYLVNVMSQMQKAAVIADEKLLRTIEEFRTNIKRALLAKEQRKPFPEIISHGHFQKGWKRFLYYYSPWLNKMPAPVEEDPFQPYYYQARPEFQRNAQNSPPKVSAASL